LNDMAGLAHSAMLQSRLSPRAAIRFSLLAISNVEANRKTIVRRSRGIEPSAAGASEDHAPSMRLTINISRLADALRSASPALIFGLRLWIAVCMALYLAFYLGTWQRLLGGHVSSHRLSADSRCLIA
jgi:uncharacterized membrane protein YccC